MDNFHIRAIEIHRKLKLSVLEKDAIAELALLSQMNHVIKTRIIKIWVNKTRVITRVVKTINIHVKTQMKQDTEEVNILAEHFRENIVVTERNYSQTERETLAVVWSCEHFHLYLLGVEFSVITDHKPLVSIVQLSVKGIYPGQCDCIEDHQISWLDDQVEDVTINGIDSLGVDGLTVDDIYEATLTDGT